jgi:hypothetical protein
MNAKNRQVLLRCLSIGILVILGWTTYQCQRLIDQDREVRFINHLPVFLPNARILKALSMGYYSAMADYFWIRSVIYFGRRVLDHDNIYYLYDLYDGDQKKVDEVRTHHEKYHSHGESYETHQHGESDQIHQQKHKAYQNALSETLGRPVPPDSIPFVDSKAIPHLFDFPSYGLMDYLFPLIDRVTQLNPYFKTPYIFSSIAVLSETGNVDWAIQLMKHGYTYNPDEWEFPFYLGYIYWLYKGSLDQTIQYLKEAVQKPECPPYVGTLLIGFSEATHQEEMTRFYLLSMLESTENQVIRERIERVISDMETHQESFYQDVNNGTEKK